MEKRQLTEAQTLVASADQSAIRRVFTPASCVGSERLVHEQSGTAQPPRFHPQQHKVSVLTRWRRLGLWFGLWFSLINWRLVPPTARSGSDRCHLIWILLRLVQLHFITEQPAVGTAVHCVTTTGFNLCQSVSGCQQVGAAARPIV